MSPISFRICLTTITLLLVDFAIGSDLQDFVNTIMSAGEYSVNDSRQHFSKKSLVIFVGDESSEIAEENYKDRKLLLRSQNMSGVHLKVDKNQGMPTTSINRNNAKHGHRRPAKNRSRNRSLERIKNLEQSAILKREREHERRVKEIVDHVSVHHQSCIYLTYEARRIKTGGIVMDEFRKMAEDVEKPKYQGLKAKALDCGKFVPEPAPLVWHRPNHPLIHIVKDSLNDGVY